MTWLVRFLKEWVPPIAVAILLSFTIRTYVAEAVKIPSNSMVPTINVDDRLVITKWSSADDLEFGDIVVFTPPFPSEHDRLIKRLIGLGGDTIEIREGFLYRNGEKVMEPYLNEPINYSYGPITVPEGKYFFLGDNRNISFDSHLWPEPFVDKDDIIGKAVFRYFPLTQMKEM